MMGKREAEELGSDKSFEDLVELMRKLRGEGGCPWDKEQTHESLKPYLVEEVYEVIDAIDSHDAENLKEELGDLLFQIFFHSQMASENKEFDIRDVMKACLEKMTARHPHVFGDVRLETAEEVLKIWHKVKMEEKGEEEKSVLGSVPKHLPALQKAQKLQKKASRVGFDWEKVEDVVAKVEEELQEVKEAMALGRHEEVEEEIGDLLFAAANLSRFLKINPEEALHKAVKKFVKRFERIESELAAKGRDIEECSLEEMDSMWEAIKRE
ncbi:MAG: nucleoside triphosphate pyrophosphohydrolase [Candidatus Brocadiales bacterium]